jgi:glucose-6-phosphate isomerase
MHLQIYANIQQILKSKPSVYIIIGIGGSNLSTYAVYQALSGTLYNKSHNASCKVYFADTLDSILINTLVKIIQEQLSVGNTIHMSCISKSGTTLETIINFKILLDILKTYHPETWHHYITIITDYKSPLWHYAHDNNIDALVIPNQVGGRFSIFSAVGLLPLALLHVDIDQLCAGARDAINNTLQSDTLDTLPAISAALIYHYYVHGIHIHDTFVFAPQLEGFGKWYRQLCAESLGKQNNQGKRVGITPTVSIGTTDLHSTGQLYIAGPQDRITTFIYASYNNDIKTTSDILFDYIFNLHDIEISYNKAMHAILQATQQTYTKHSHPFITITLSELSAYTIGMLMQYKMLEIMYLGYLLQVNPFDQPNVEEYKTNIRTLLFV